MGRQTKPSDVPGIRWDLGFDQDNVKHNGSTAPRAMLMNPACRLTYLTSSKRLLDPLQFARDKFFQLDDVGREFANAFRGLLRGHCVLVQKPPEFFLV